MQFAKKILEMVLKGSFLKSTIIFYGTDVSNKLKEFQIRLDQICLKWIKLDQIGLNWIKKDQDELG